VNTQKEIPELNEALEVIVLVGKMGQALRDVPDENLKPQLMNCFVTMIHPDSERVCRKDKLTAAYEFYLFASALKGTSEETDTVIRGLGKYCFKQLAITPEEFDFIEDFFADHVRNATIVPNDQMSLLIAKARSTARGFRDLCKLLRDET
jgi:hypothetical protein